MPDTVIAAFITVSGMVIVATASVISQLFITKSIIKAERERVLEQIRGEELSRARDKRIERIVDGVSELLGTSDPQTIIDYSQTVRLILRVQLLLNLRIPDESNLNSALNKLGRKVQTFLSVASLPIDDKLVETKELLQAQGEVITATNTILLGHHKLAT